MIAETLKWVGGVDGYLEVIDQRKLPDEFVKVQCREVGALYEAIVTLTVRGAPAIGVAGAYGLVLALQKLGAADDLEKALSTINQSCEYLASARPTGVNLSWALKRVRNKAEDFVGGSAQAKLEALRDVVLAEANAIRAEDEDMCRRIGENGKRFIKKGGAVLTHCNAGALATAGQGTALSVLFEAHKRGREFAAYVDETRPLLQGARLTAWELQQAGIETTVICDNMAGWLMKEGKIDAVITGADRIAANGDAANKIGTYSLSILAREHNVPFYIAAPSSTFDLNIKSGDEIPIEQRADDEVRFFGDKRIAPDGVGVWNPAFDVTQAKDITAIITERGVIEGPTAGKIAEHLK